MTKRSIGGITIRRLCPELYLRDGPTIGIPVLVAGTATGWPAGVALPMTLGTSTPCAGGGWLTPFSFQFSVNQLKSFTELQPVFDMYRLNWVKVFITYNSNVATTGSVASLPAISWYPDYDDDVVSVPDLIRERMGVRRLAFSADRRTVCLKVLPKMQMAVGTDLTQVDAVVTRPRFVDCTESDVQFFGVKGYIENAGWAARDPVSTEPMTSFKVDVQMSVTLRGVI